MQACGRGLLRALQIIPGKRRLFHVKQDLAQLEQMVRNRICSVCTERTVNGECGMEEPANCALFRLFPQVAEAIQAVDSGDIRDYIDAIRSRVCALCHDQAADGSCETRQQVRCALDAYLLPVVDAIEEATGKTFNKKGMGLSAGAPVRLGPEIRL
jgi:hypothetical protein